MALGFHHANRAQVRPCRFSREVPELVDRPMAPDLHAAMIAIGGFKIIVGNAEKILFPGRSEIVLDIVAKVSLIAFQRQDIVRPLGANLGRYFFLTPRGINAHNATVDLQRP